MSRAAWTLLRILLWNALCDVEFFCLIEFTLTPGARNSSSNAYLLQRNPSHRPLSTIPLNIPNRKRKKKVQGYCVEVSLELHLVWAVALAEGEGRSEIAGKELLLLDGGKDGLVDCLLVGGTAR